MSYRDLYCFYSDYEEPEPSKQPRCPSCGKFLPLNPNAQVMKTEPNGHMDYKNDIWIVDGPDYVFPAEPLWKCLCGAMWESSEIKEFQ